jgi:hypothetical protein
MGSAAAFWNPALASLLTPNHSDILQDYGDIEVTWKNDHLGERETKVFSHFFPD